MSMSPMLTVMAPSKGSAGDHSSPMANSVTAFLPGQISRQRQMFESFWLER